MAAASVRTELIEANPVRAVIHIERRAPLRERDRHRPDELTQWRYTIYPTGQVFVRVESNRAPRSLDRPPGLAVAVRDAGSSTTQILSGSASAASASNDLESRGHIGALVSFSEPQASLLFVPCFGETSSTIEERRNAAGVITMVATPSTTRNDLGDRTCAVAYLRLAPSTPGRAEALREAEWFVHPPSPKRFVGTPLEFDDPCDMATGGFVRARGARVVAPEGNLVRFNPAESSFDVNGQAFEIHRVGDRRAWVYVGQRLHEPTALSPDGAVLFQLPPKTQANTTLEVLLANP